MLLQLFLGGDVVLALMILSTIILSLSFHEYGHAWSAKMYGDDTAERLGRLTINPISHIDPMGLLMVIVIGFGFAKPVPFNPNNFKSMWGVAGVAFAGPMANLIIAFVMVNIQSLAIKFGWVGPDDQNFLLFSYIVVRINLLLMLFNLIPLGVLDGHHILPYFLPKKLSRSYRTLNAQYGMIALLGIIVVSYIGVFPLLGFLATAADAIASFLKIV